MQSTILIVQEDLDMQDLLTDALSCHGFHSVTVTSGASALQLLATTRLDLILLDVLLPDLSGFAVCREIRTISNVPIIFVSKLKDHATITRALELGGDDYVTQPFDLHELTARIEANLRRAALFNRQRFAKSEKSRFQYEVRIIDNIKIDYHLRTVYVNDEIIHLSTKEFQIFSTLAQQPEKTFSAEELYTLIWGTDSLGETKTLKVHISHLRKKLKAYTGHSSIIRTVRGFGYQFCYEDTKPRNFEGGELRNQLSNV